MATNPPRAVFVTRETDYERLLARHATREQARFFLTTRGQSIETAQTQHERFQAVLAGARSVVPGDWRQALVRRADFDRFLFAPEDVVIAIGQDGLIANVAKYLAGQPVLGVNPMPDLWDGVLARVAPERLAKLLSGAAHGDLPIEPRTMAEAKLVTGETMVALNELFIGHQSHQSARYEISAGDSAEFQSSSGMIVATGTGATGWARSIMEATGSRIALAPTDPRLGFFVREPFPSISTGCTLRSGLATREAPLSVTSRMNDRGVIFADGMEQDYLPFNWGETVRVGPADRVLNLATG